MSRCYNAAAGHFFYIINDGLWLHGLQLYHLMWRLRPQQLRRPHPQQLPQQSTWIRRRQLQLLLLLLRTAAIGLLLCMLAQPVVRNE